MAKQLIISIRITLVLLVLVSVVYPLVIYGISQALFASQANGSLVRNSQGQIVGSKLLAQGFTKPEYFQPRPSAAGNGYDPTSSGGTNLGPTSDKLINGIHKKLANGKDDPTNFDGVKDLAAEYRTENGLGATDPVPVDAVTRSASGLDPGISVRNADLQEARVAKTRGISPQQVDALVKSNTASPTLGFIGAESVNVLQLNMSLDKEYPLKTVTK